MADGIRARLASFICYYHNDGAKRDRELKQLDTALAILSSCGINLAHLEACLSSATPHDAGMDHQHLYHIICKLHHQSASLLGASSTSTSSNSATSSSSRTATSATNTSSSKKHQGRKQHDTHNLRDTAPTQPLDPGHPETPNDPKHYPLSPAKQAQHAAGSWCSPFPTDPQYQCCEALRFVRRWLVLSSRPAAGFAGLLADAGLTAAWQELLPAALAGGVAQLLCKAGAQEALQGHKTPGVQLLGLLSAAQRCWLLGDVVAGLIVPGRDSPPETPQHYAALQLMLSGAVSCSSTGQPQYGDVQQKELLQLLYQQQQCDSHHQQAWPNFKQSAASKVTPSPVGSLPTLVAAIETALCSHLGRLMHVALQMREAAAETAACVSVHEKLRSRLLAEWCQQGMSEEQCKQLVLSQEQPVLVLQQQYENMREQLKEQCRSLHTLMHAVSPLVSLAHAAHMLPVVFELDIFEKAAKLAQQLLDAAVQHRQQQQQHEAAAAQGHVEGAGGAGQHAAHASFRQQLLTRIGQQKHQDLLCHLAMQSTVLPLLDLIPSSIKEAQLAISVATAEAADALAESVTFSKEALQGISSSRQPLSAQLQVARLRVLALPQEAADAARKAARATVLSLGATGLGLLASMGLQGICNTAVCADMGGGSSTSSSSALPAALYTSLLHVGGGAGHLRDTVKAMRGCITEQDKEVQEQLMKQGGWLNAENLEHLASVLQHIGSGSSSSSSSSVGIGRSLAPERLAWLLSEAATAAGECEAAPATGDCEAEAAAAAGGGEPAAMAGPAAAASGPRCPAQPEALWRLLLAVSPSSCHALHCHQLPAAVRSFDAFQAAVLGWPTPKMLLEDHCRQRKSVVQRQLGQQQQRSSSRCRCGVPGHSYIPCLGVAGSGGDPSNSSNSSGKRAVCASPVCVCTALHELAAAGPPAAESSWQRVALQCVGDAVMVMTGQPDIRDLVLASTAFQERCASSLCVTQQQYARALQVSFCKSVSVAGLVRRLLLLEAVCQQAPWPSSPTSLFSPLLLGTWQQQHLMDLKALAVMTPAAAGDGLAAGEAWNSSTDSTTRRGHDSNSVADSSSSSGSSPDSGWPSGWTHDGWHPQLLAAVVHSAQGQCGTRQAAALLDQLCRQQGVAGAGGAAGGQWLAGAGACGDAEGFWDDGDGDDDGTERLVDGQLAGLLNVPPRHTHSSKEAPGCGTRQKQQQQQQGCGVGSQASSAEGDVLSLWAGSCVSQACRAVLSCWVLAWHCTVREQGGDYSCCRTRAAAAEAASDLLGPSLLQHIRLPAWQDIMPAAAAPTTAAGEAEPAVQQCTCSSVVDDHEPGPGCIWWSSSNVSRGSSFHSSSNCDHSNKQWCEALRKAAAGGGSDDVSSHAADTVRSSSCQPAAVCDCCGSALPAGSGKQGHKQDKQGAGAAAGPVRKKGAGHGSLERQGPSAAAAAVSLAAPHYCSDCGVACYCHISCAVKDWERHRQGGACRLLQRLAQKGGADKPWDSLTAPPPPPALPAAAMAAACRHKLGL